MRAMPGQTHKDKHDKNAHDEMGFEDFFDVQLLRSHSGFHLLHMDEFLSKEGRPLSRSA